VFLVASTNAAIGLPEAMALLRGGASATDAVEVAIRAVEANVEEHSVGVGGYPNLLGEVELDAGLMQGHDLTSGSVAALRDYPHAISVARKVMERLPHVLLVDRGAARFAAEMGFEPTPLLTESARETWAQGLQPEMSAEDLAHIGKRRDLWRWVEIASDPERTGGTTNVIARDMKGHLCVGVSTSGWAWKYPGRVGDSPLVGAGFYADDRYGAAACTGAGEMAIRAVTAHSILMYMRLGLSLIEAGARAMGDLNDLGGRYLAAMNVIAVDADGHHAGFSSHEHASYLYFDVSTDAPVELPRKHVPLTLRWEKYGVEPRESPTRSSVTR
jgi:L-asparaginase / beta-aspartyl-peptidase